jgi:hypothetical protein
VSEFVEFGALDNQPQRETSQPHQGGSFGIGLGIGREGGDQNSAHGSPD